MTKKENENLIDWLCSNDTGTSSICIVRHMVLGVTKEILPAFISKIYAPYDKWDRGRCIRLLQRVPSWIPRLDEMSKYGEQWTEQIKLIKKEMYD